MMFAHVWSVCCLFCPPNGCGSKCWWIQRGEWSKNTPTDCQRDWLYQPILGGYRFFFLPYRFGGWGNVVAWSFYMLMTPLFSQPHMLHHTFRFLERHAPNLGYMESPLADSCQQDETFVGIISRYSRRASPKSTIDRTLDLYLAALRKHLVRE